MKCIRLVLLTSVLLALAACSQPTPRSAVSTPESPLTPPTSSPKTPLTSVAPSSLADYGWDELSAISSEISVAFERGGAEEALRVASSYLLCDEDGSLSNAPTKRVTLTDGLEVDVRLVGIAHDNLTNASGRAGLTFMACGCVAEFGMNLSPSNRGGWEASEMRAWLNDGFLDLLPSDLRSVLKPVNKMTSNGNEAIGPQSVSATSDTVWLASFIELQGHVTEDSYVLAGGEAGWYETYYSQLFTEGVQYEYFSEGSAGVGAANPLLQMEWLPSTPDVDGYWKQGNACSWWERSPSPDSTKGFMNVNEAGNPFMSYQATDLFGVVPFFCV